MKDEHRTYVPLFEAIQRLGQLERQLAEADVTENRYKLLFDQSALGIFVGDPTGSILDANCRALTLLGYAREELIGQSIATFIHPDDLRQTGIMEGPKAVLSGKPFVIERRLLRKDGAYLPTRVHFGLFDAEKTLFQVMFQDISVEKTAEEATVAALAQARAANAAKSVFLANMSHEIRTPLNGIMGMLQLALASSPTEEIRDYLATALQSSEALLRVLSDVLDVARLDSGRLHLCQDVFSLADVIRPIADFFSPQARLKGLQFTVHVDPAVPDSLRGDAARLRQMLHNLLANAVKYTNAGGVRLEVNLVEAGNHDAVLDVSVRDTGIGIAPDNQERIFDAFSQADSSLTRAYGGPGLGLTIVKGLAALMQAQLHVCSELSQGTTVRLRLRLPLGRMTRREPTDRPKPNLVGVRVLVVEDERINRLTIAAMLGKFGCVYELAENGHDALDKLGKQRFDCVLMDMQMPVLDGLEATRRIRSGQEAGVRSDIPIVALTAHAQDMDREIALAAGVDDYVSKPVDMDILARAIAKRLGLHYD